jgi:ribosomal 50S subunit-recycling heat shock protein
MYKWTKTYAVNTKFSDPVEIGQIIEVDAASGSSKQKVLSVTVRRNQKGDEYKTVIVEAV